MARCEWMTEKGNRIAIEVETAETTEVAYADGWNVETKKTEKRITRMTLNGTQVEEPRFDHQLGDRAKFRLGGREGAAIIPEDILTQIWAEERAALKASMAAVDKCEAERKTILDAMAGGETHR